MTNGTNSADVLENLKLELRRGCLIVAVLAQLRVEQYGYTLRKALADDGLAIDEGTLYPLLRRLETQGLLVSQWREEEKRNKRFYRLSPAGEQILSQLLEEWHDINTSLGKILQEARPRANVMSTSSSRNPKELVDRYLQAVRFWVPRSRQDCCRGIARGPAIADRRQRVRTRPSARRRGSIGDPEALRQPDDGGQQPGAEASADRARIVSDLLVRLKDGAALDSGAGLHLHHRPQ